MGCNCGNASGAAAKHTLIKADGTRVTYASRTEAVAALSVEPGGKVVVATS